MLHELTVTNYMYRRHARTPRYGTSKRKKIRASGCRLSLRTPRLNYIWTFFAFNVLLKQNCYAARSIFTFVLTDIIQCVILFSVSFGA